MKTSDLLQSDASKHILLVCIGAAKGGLQAACELFEQLKPGTGLAFAYIQHVEEELSGEMICAEIERATQMKVTIAAPAMSIEPDHVYIVPATKDLMVAEEAFKLRKSAAEAEISTPIDDFFSSLAEHHPTIIGVLLSGGDHDGTLGLKAIRLAGGITFAQDDSAQFGEMPSAAINEGVADFVLPPAGIARELEKISQINGLFTEARHDQQAGGNDHEQITGILNLIKKVTSVDFTNYKISTIKRRIIRRMLLYRLDSLKKYQDYLKQHTNEVSVLYNDLLINVTSFFRDGDSMEYLKKTILPQIIRSKAEDEPIRVWVPACSTGEEAYSIAMLLVEIQEESGFRQAIQVFGTDLSELAITKARQGRYGGAELANISESRLSAFFEKTDHNTYRIHKKIRDLCVFAQHNLLKDPPFSRLDLVSCCNLFIYLNNTLQEKCIGIFFYSLQQNGYLVLGRSETIIAPGQQYFSQLEKKFKVYVKKAHTPFLASASEPAYRLPSIEKKPAPEKEKTGTETITEIPSLEKTVDDILYGRYIPASIVINQQLEILQFRGSTNLFLEPSRGKASFNLLKMARSGLIFDLRNCIHKAAATKSPVKKNNIELTVKQQTYNVSIEVIPLESANDERLFLIIFEEQPPVPTDLQSIISKDEVIQKLQQELNDLRADMRSIIEEQEANKEELQSANEEIISTNEELQSINEELETSKEELESTNEELTSINTELKISNDQLTEAQNYAQAIFETIREAVIILTKGLRVKMANASFYRIFNMQSEDTEGRSLYDLGTRQWNTPQIRGLLHNIQNNGVQLIGYELQFDISDIGQRTMLLNGRKIIQTTKNQELIMLAFEDITDRRIAEKMTAEREEWFKNMANNAPVMIWTAGPDGLRTFFNVTWFTYTGRDLDQEKGNGWITGVYPDDRKNFLAIYQKAFEERKTFRIEYRLRRYDGEYRWVQAIGRPTFSADQEFTGFVGICTEIHDAKIVQEELERLVDQRTADLREANEALYRSNSELQQFAYVASHDLQEPLRKILTFSDRLISSGDFPRQHQLYIDKIADSAERMSQLIHDLLDFSRAIKIDEAFTYTDLNQVLVRVLSDFEIIIKEKNAIITTAQLPVIVAIPLQMEQLFHNLLSNALKFSKPHSPAVITIHCRDISPEEAQELIGTTSGEPFIEIIIEDNGIGFGNEFAEQIFTIFQRLNGRDEFPGTGIGLALCRKITDNHGGKIYATSIEHLGSKFHILLPVKP